MMICYFVYNLGAYSGAAFQALSIAKRLSFPVLIFNMGAPFTGVVPARIRIVNIEKWSISNLGRIVCHLLSSKIKIVHFHGQFLLPMLVVNFIRKPYVLKTTLLGDDDFESLRSKRFGALRLWLSRSCSINIVLSNRLMEINARYINSKKIRHVPNGVAVANDRLALAEKLNYFYFCGVISERKQTLKAIKVFAENYAYLDGAKLFVIGPDKSYGLGREANVDYISKCKNYVSEHGLSDRVEFTGLLSQDDVLRLINRCKALLFFSDFEGMPNAVLEAMASNCAPIISSMQGVGFELVGNDSGFICEEAMPSISEIDKLITSHAPHKRATSCFSFEACTKSLNKIYFDLLRSPA